MAREKIEVTVVRNDKEKQAQSKSGLFIPTALPHYDIKKIVGAADVRMEEVVQLEGVEESSVKVKAYLVGSQISHEQLAYLCRTCHTYEVTVLDGSTQR